jgi:spermidine/putrescine transport system permease protein
VYGGRWKNTLILLAVLPVFITFLIRVLSWTLILSDNGPVVDALQATGLLASDQYILATPLAVIGGLTYTYLPFMVLPIYAVLYRMDEVLLDVAADLYSTGRDAFFRVTWPLALPGVLAGSLLTFILTIGDYANAEFLGGPSSKMIGNVIFDRYLTVTDYPGASALSVSLMVGVLAVVLLYIRVLGTRTLARA